ncbi:MAG: ABC transporter substrate-binding protein [Chloroflexi bacterium]|nr:ABC transporter substrate-binding protein [Chloroflexota bacterium]MYD17719.1 ABC transporter substrate-binding protein [Chloroflexota bacterium]MYF22757.1 ABC transporter substrate-binding protein [Chloroflexota bacterium]MYJ02275.1 ABC transporter substrate-binding protein [Chloroflexota bacterium]
MGLLDSDMLKRTGLGLVAMVAAAAIGLGVAACSSDDEQQQQTVAQAEQPEEQPQQQAAAQTEQAAEQPQQQAAMQQQQTQQQQTMQAEEEAAKDTIVFSDLNWLSAEVQTRIVAYIVEHGYGYPTELVAGDTVSLWAGLTTDNTHVTLEIWPAQQPWIDELGEGVIELLGDSLDENWEGWVVPQYVKDANPGLVSVFDIPDYADLFVTADSEGKARFVGCIAGWACEMVNANKVVAYELEDSVFVVDPGSGAALFADLEGAYARGDAWLGYIWGPTKPTATLDLYRLEEPEWSEECWNGDQGCAYPSSEVRIAVNVSLIDRAPDVIEFLRNWDYTAAEQIDVEIWMGDNGETPDAGAIWYLQNFQDVWSQRVDEGVVDRVLAALAEES